MTTVPALQILVGLALAVATGFWIPVVVRSYGRDFFEWSEAQRMPLPSVLILTVASVSWYTVATHGRPMLTWGACLAAAAMIAALAGIVAADLRFQLIPDRFQLVGLAGALAYAAQRGTLENVGFALVLGFALWVMNGLYRKFRQRDGLGFGDVKMLAWLEIALGSDVLVVLIFACMAAAVAVLPAVIRKKCQPDSTFAFGPFLVLGVAALAVLQSL